MQDDRDRNKDGSGTEPTKRNPNDKDTIGPGGRPTPPDHRGDNQEPNKKPEDAR